VDAADDLAKRIVAGRSATSPGTDDASVRWASLAASLTVGRPARWAPVAALAVGGVPFAAFTILLLYHFYIKGSFFWDSGLLAYVMSQGDWRLPTPPIFGGDSFFATHFAVIFIPLSLIRPLLPVSDAQFFAGFSGLCHALPGLAVFWLLHAGFRLRTSTGVAVAMAVGLAFSFNGLALGIARYPHFEMLIVGGALLFLVALIQRRLVLAGVFFAICLATREDAGFHIFAVLFLVIALNRCRGLSWRMQRAEIAFAAIAICYSVSVLALQHAMFPAQSSFARIYLGDPAFRKLTVAVLTERLLGYMQYRTYIVLPALIAGFWAVRARNPYIVLGYAAFLPWAVLHLLADSDIAGTLSAYYAYPFMIASFWPLIGVLLEERVRGSQAPAALSVLAFTAMIAGSWTAVAYQANPGRIDLPAGFLSAPSIARQAMTDRAMTALVRAKSELGTVFVDGSVLALAPDGYVFGETVWGGKDQRPNTVIYFVHGYEADAARKIADAARLDLHYQVPGTSIRLATDRAIAPASPLAAFIAPADTSE
jgi:hypothetical protein